MSETAPTREALPVVVEDLTVTYGKSAAAHTALHEVSLSASAGSLVTLLGPSGSGKTTLLRAIAGLLDPQHGSIRFGDRVVFENGRSVATRDRELGMVFQSFALWPHMTVQKNIAYPLVLQNWSGDRLRERTESLLAQVGLAGLGGRRPSELSGGQQQRVGLARAIARHPGVLLMDEPLSNLDAQLREEMRLVIKTLQNERNHTTIYVTHDRTEALALSDLVVILKDGRIVASGAPRDLYQSPPDAFTARFLGDWNVVAALEGLSVPWLGQVPGVDGRTCRCGGRCQVMVRRQAPFRVVDDAHRLAKGEVGGQVIAHEFVGDHVELDATIDGTESTVKLIAAEDDRLSGLRTGARVALAASELAVLCDLVARTED